MSKIKNAIDSAVADPFFFLICSLVILGSFVIILLIEIIKRKKRDEKDDNYITQAASIAGKDVSVTPLSKWFHVIDYQGFKIYISIVGTIDSIQIYNKYNQKLFEVYDPYMTLKSARKLAIKWLEGENLVVKKRKGNRNKRRRK
ncbi:MAG: hypothetical protein DRQ46_00555 [Gammaproteobacteria bacterium]|nr:MAG: hypothetical protein DRQ46_00555 [Gammaproteobacteria bacterium]